MKTVTAEALSAYHDHELAPDEALRLRRDLDDDAELRALLATFEKVDDAVRAEFALGPAEPVPLNLVRSVRSGFAARRRAAFARTAARWVGPAVAAALVLVLGNEWTAYRVESALAKREAQIAALADRAVQDALEHALSGSAVSLADAGAGSTVSITPIRTYRSESQHWCREFIEEVVVEGEKVTRFGLACREADGDWRRVQTRLPGATPPPIGTSL